ncbi:D-alanine--D-serine ligase VanG [Diplocloster agilis]|uniref:D-alanine--D-serine ligase VanG n=1 Tax=Diplocloster agilis TaxID=2850323 RepID=UPI0008230DE4|nr:D-alanine--D-serine ligase VanG [Suonthocola fibrivorans]MCU6733475.1 D-alanine--D-serine ligase VanG [Suonthocola fibrivorans]SCI94385.1 Vancomycin/teicoplanin A-type resistance protein VanA [uncultured Clostridium sp.]
MELKSIAVLFGGNSNEYEVSLESAHAVITHLNREKYEVIPVGITREGGWYRFRGDAEKILADTWCNGQDCTPAIISPDRTQRCLIEFRQGSTLRTPLDLAFPVLHGKNGEDGTVQGLIQLAGIPLVGCDTLSSAVGMDKDIAHTIVRAAGVKVPRSVVLYEEIDREKLAGCTSTFTYPLYVKPVKAGSSFGITRVTDASCLIDAVQSAFQVDDKVVIEEEIPGFEVGCSVLGNLKLVIGTVDEIECPGGFFDFEEKYHRKEAKIHMPARIDTQTAAKIRETAAIIYRALNCKGFARVDMFLTPEGDVVFNEVNTIPGLTAVSRYPSMLKDVGISFEEMLDRLVGLAMQDGK